MTSKARMFGFLQSQLLLEISKLIAREIGINSDKYYLASADNYL